MIAPADDVIEHGSTIPAIRGILKPPSSYSFSTFALLINNNCSVVLGNYLRTVPSYIRIIEAAVIHIFYVGSEGKC